MLHLHRRRLRALTLIEVLVVVIILAVLVSIALPLYLNSIRDSEINTCKTNMSTIATAVQAKKVRDGSYYNGAVDAAAVTPDGPLRDLQPGAPQCPGGSEYGYEVSTGEEPFEITCKNPTHTFKWAKGGFTG